MKKEIVMIALLLILLVFIFVFITGISLIENSAWQNNLTSVRFSATVLGDIDNDGDLDLIVSGCLTAGASANLCNAGVLSRIYTNNGTSFVENQTWQQNLTEVGWGALALGDIDNDGDLDLILAGSVDGINGYSSKVYINNGTSFVENSIWQQNITNAKLIDGSIALGDIDNDGDLDLILSGIASIYNSNGFYINNGTTFIRDSAWNQDYTDDVRTADTLVDIDNDGDLDLVHWGYNYGYVYINNRTSMTKSSVWQANMSGMDHVSIASGDIDNDGDFDFFASSENPCRADIYINNGNTLLRNSTWENDLLLVFWGGSVFGDYDNNGYLDLAYNGECGGSTYARVYNNTGTTFVRDSIADSTITEEGQGSWILGNIDNDADLDLITTGASGLKSFGTKIYISNASRTKNNSQSSSPNTFSSSYLGGVLNLTWNNGSDGETPVLGLYYNLMVGNSTDNHTIVSGVYGGSSNPTAGYFGNMMQRKNMSFNKYLSADTYYWYVQTIDTGLRKSNWSARQSVVVGADVSVPNISSVSSSVTSSTATITWTTNESANSTVHYGITNATTSSSSLDDLVISHSVSLSSLSASTLYYYNVSSCDYWNNCNTSIQYNFTTSATPVTPPPGGGSSGGSSTTTTITPTIPEFDVDFSTSTSGIFEVKAGDIKTFSFQGEIKHNIAVMAVTSNSMTLLITSDPITIQVLLGEIKQIDMNQDGIDDLEIKLNSIISGKASFSLTKLEGADIAGEQEIEEAIGKEALFDVKISLSNLFKTVKSGREIIASIEVLNVNNIGQVDVLVDYYISDGENNTIAEGSDTLAVEAVASFVRSLTVPYNLKSGKYLFNVDISYGGEIMASGSTEFRVVRGYWMILGIGIIILIVAGIFFYLWRIKRREEKLEKREKRDIGLLKREISKLKKRRKRRKHGRSKNR